MLGWCDHETIRRCSRRTYWNDLGLGHARNNCFLDVGVHVMGPRICIHCGEPQEPKTITKLRKLYGITQYNVLAKKLNMSPEYLSRIVTGYKPVPEWMEEVVRVAENNRGENE